MQRITLFKSRNGVTSNYRRRPIEELVEDIKGIRYRNIVEEFRRNYPLIMRESAEQRKALREFYLKDLPHVLFSVDMGRYDGKTTVYGCNNLVTLTVSNLRDMDTAVQIRDAAALLPYTRLCFVGNDAHSVVIVCEVMPVGAEVTDENSHRELYKRGFLMLRRIYSDHANTVVDLSEDNIMTHCQVSYDRDAYYNATPTPLPVNMTVDTKRLLCSNSAVPQVKDRETFYDWRRVFCDNFRKAQSDCFNANDRKYETLLTLARYCHETGMPQGLAEGFAIRNGEYCNDEVLVSDTFACEYEKDLREMVPDKYVNKTSELMIRTMAFIDVHYRMRRNTLNGKVEYRLNDGSDFEYHLLDDKMQNTMTIKALESGLKSWDKDMARYINSKFITEYDPINTWLDGLPKWDGKDRITELARRVPTKNQNWPAYFHTWMLSMVAQWMGKDSLHGNAIAPILIGAQATGKSTFCRMLLPEHLQEYYNDSIHFKDDKSVFLALSSFALINIDEFDSLSRSQQPLLKYLISKTDVKYRAAYKSFIEQHKRYASFIATTNKSQPLSDPTGSRRFICVKIEEVIDTTTPVEHDQMYAQLVSEINSGERYWFTKEECDALTIQNTPFQLTTDLREMILSLFRPATTKECVEPMAIHSIAEELTRKYPYLHIEYPEQVIGKALNRLGFIQKRRQNLRKYLVIKK